MSIDPTITTKQKLLKQVTKDLDRHEGYREFAYPDVIKPLHKRYPNERWGFVPASDILKKLGVSEETATKDGAPWTVGFGFTKGVNLHSRMPRLQAERKLEEHILEMDANLTKTLTFYKDTTFVTQTVLINMAFNMGLAGLLGFNNTLQFMKEKKWSNAAANMRASKWYRQVTNRASELARRIETQEIPVQYRS